MHLEILILVSVIDDPGGYQHKILPACQINDADILIYDFTDDRRELIGDIAQHLTRSLPSCSLYTGSHCK